MAGKKKKSCKLISFFIWAVGAQKLSFEFGKEIYQ